MEVCNVLLFCEVHSFEKHPHDGNAARKKTFSPSSVNVQAEAPKILRRRGRLKGEGICGGILKGFLKWPGKPRMCLRGDHQTTPACKKYMHNDLFDARLGPPFRTTNRTPAEAGPRPKSTRFAQKVGTRKKGPFLYQKLVFCKLFS